MTLSLSQVMLPLYRQQLPQALVIINKAEAWCRAKGLPAIQMCEARLAPDMWDFATQLRAVCLYSAGALEAALSGVMRPDFSGPTDIDGLREAIKGAIARVQAVDASALDALGNKKVAVRVGGGGSDFTAENFLLSFVLPNFQFHLTTAYAIMRMKGVSLGKMDFLGQLRISAYA